MIFNEYDYIIVPLIIGFILDAIFGDPVWLPHPIRLFGQLISFFEKRFNKNTNKQLKGAIVSVFLIGITWFSFWIFLKFISEFYILHLTILSVLVFYGIANRCLINESYKVIHKLNKEGLDAGRRQLSFIVGRDTKNLSENQVRIAVLETMAENLSDGVIAPLFYYAIGGVPLMFAYKMANTLDSMIGYKSEKYKDFGRFAAKLDDVLNYIPARLTALLMIVLSLSLRGLRFVFKYGNKHASPNAGYPEAALAGILNCRFGGPNIYHGKLIDKPYIGKNCREIKTGDFNKTVLVNFFSSLIMSFVIVFLYI